MKTFLRGRWLLIELLALLTLGTPTAALAQSSTITTTACPILTGGTAAGAGCVVQNTTSVGTVSIQIENAFSGTISFKISNDMANWAALDVYKTTAPTTAVNTTTTTGLYIAPVFGSKYVLVGFTSFTSGTAAVTMSTAMANPIALMARSIGSGTTDAFATTNCTAPGATFTGDTDTGIGYLGANNAALCAGGATIADWNASRVLFAQPIYAADGTASAPTLAKGSNPTTGWWFSATNAARYSALGVDVIQLDANRVALASGMALSWGDGTTITGTGSYDLSLFRGGADIFEQRRGTNAQTQRWYHTYTDASNYERVSIEAVNGSGARINYAQAAGTGTARPFVIALNGTAKWQWSATTGDFLASTDNVTDIGASGATRPRSGYFGTSVVAPLFQLAANGNTIAVSGGGSATQTFWTSTQTTGRWQLTGDNAQNHTSTYNPFANMSQSFTPASGSGSWAALELRPTINGVSSGKAAGLAIASLTNTLTGGTTYLVDAGTTTTDYVTGFTRKFSVDTGGNADAVGSYKLNAVLMESATAPTIASGGCSSPAVTWAKGTAAFKLTIGSSCSGVKTITLTLPAASNAWVCWANDVTTPASFVIAEHSSSTTAVVLGNYARTTGLAIDFTAAEVLLVGCHGG